MTFIITTAAVLVVFNYLFVGFMVNYGMIKAKAKRPKIWLFVVAFWPYFLNKF